MMFIDKEINIKNKRILIISGKKSFYKSGIKKYLALNGCEICYYFKKRKNPELNELNKIIKKKISFNPDVTIGIGGGSVLDLTKIAATISSKKIAKDKINKIKFLKKTKLILVPTTAGSGSESTNFAVLYVGRKKYSISSKQMSADHVFYFLKTLDKLSKISKISSSLDVLCQAVESMFSVKSNRVSLNYSRKALKLLQKNMKLYLKKKSSKINKDMFLAANFAGKAIKTTKTNVPHALSYFFSSNFKIDHGLAVFINLFGFLHFLYLKRDGNRFLKNRFNKLFHYLKVKAGSKRSFYDLISSMDKIIGKSYDYERLNLKRQKNVKKIISSVNVERLKNCPINISNKDLEKIIFFNANSISN